MEVIYLQQLLIEYLEKCNFLKIAEANFIFVDVKLIIENSRRHFFANVRESKLDCFLDGVTLTAWTWHTCTLIYLLPYRKNTLRSYWPKTYWTFPLLCIIQVIILLWCKSHVHCVCFLSVTIAFLDDSSCIDSPLAEYNVSLCNTKSIDIVVVHNAGKGSFSI